MSIPGPSSEETVAEIHQLKNNRPKARIPHWEDFKKYVLKNLKIYSGRGETFGEALITINSDAVSPGSSPVSVEDNCPKFLV